MKRTLVALVTSMALCLGLCPVVSAATFSDVSVGSWYSETVSALADAGVIGGYEDGTFRPYESVTYAQALKVIMLATGYEEQPPVNGASWASGYFDRHCWID